MARSVRSTRRRTWSARRLFAAYAVVTLVPVVLIGLLLTTLLHESADNRGLAEGVARAKLVARSAITPLLDGHRVSTLDSDELVRLQRTVQASADQRQVLLLRIRDLDGRIVFPAPTTSRARIAVDDEALEAAGGETVAELTELHADDGEKAGPAVVEVYLPLRNTSTGARIGVLEMYLPYAPIAADIERGQRAIYLTLFAGLGVLWLCLIGVTASVIRHLRRETRGHAYLASHDALTGLPNRTRIAETLDALGTEARVAVAVLTVDRFRPLQDALGQANADAVLTVLADRMRTFAQQPQWVARLGNADFAVVAVGLDDTEAWLQRLRAHVAEPFDIDGLPVAVEVSVGFDELDGTDPADAETLLGHAAVALSAAQRGGRGLLRFAPEQNQHDAAALSLVAELGTAIAADELVLHFQPKYDVARGRVSSVEALVRWQHSTRGLLPPGAFLDAVEETELVDDLTRWVLRHACRAVAVLEPDIRMAVNISARSLVRPELPEEILAVVRGEGVDPSRLILEVTETAVISDPRRARTSLAQLRAAGFAISIDDFGVGQTSLSHLVAMPIDELKIDRSFVHGMLDDQRSSAVVRAVIELGHSLGISVTAEGVEDDGTLRELDQLGCDVAQGFYFSRPVPLADLQLLLDATPDPASELSPA